MNFWFEMNIQKIAYFIIIWPFPVYNLDIYSKKTVIMQGDIELLRQSFAVYIETTLPFLSNMSMRCIGQELSILLKDSTKTISDICAHATKFGSSPSKSASLH
jgi:hypothetical protein